LDLDKEIEPLDPGVRNSKFSTKRGHLPGQSLDHFDGSPLGGYGGHTSSRPFGVIANSLIDRYGDQTRWDEAADRMFIDANEPGHPAENLMPLYGPNSPLVDAYSIAGFKVVNGDGRFQNCSIINCLDYIFVSQALAGLVTGGGLERHGLWGTPTTRTRLRRITGRSTGTWKVPRIGLRSRRDLRRHQYVSAAAPAHVTAIIRPCVELYSCERRAQRASSLRLPVRRARAYRFAAIG
jgi:hypothetical protein